MPRLRLVPITAFSIRQSAGARNKLIYHGKAVVEFCFAAATDNEKAAGNRELLVVPVHQEAGHERHEGFSLVISQCIRFDFASLPNGLAVRGNIETVFGKSGYREKGIILARCIN